jgi:hypothetical protein
MSAWWLVPAFLGGMVVGALLLNYLLESSDV